MIHRKSILVYLSIAFSLSWVLLALPVLFGPLTSSSRQAAFLAAWPAAMWGPGVAAIIATIKVDDEPLSTLRLGHMGDRGPYLLAWLVPPALTVVSGALTVLFGAGVLDLEFGALRAALEAQSSGQALPPTFYVMLQIFSALTIATLFNILFALGEELGWRGYLLPKLLPLGRIRAILLTGVIWGVCHWPAILQGHNYPQHPFWGLLLMIIFCVLFGVFLSWLYLRTGSPWAPALGHASLNAVAGLPLLFVSNVDLAIGGPLTSMIGWIPLALLAGWLLWRSRLPAPEQLE